MDEERIHFRELLIQIGGGGRGVAWLVLNECHSGDGKFIRGEGNISLNRNFRFVGVPATLSSKWKAEADISAQILKQFYINLQVGHSKNQALTESIRSYLKTSSRATSHPFYWANWELYGNRHPLQFKGGIFRVEEAGTGIGFLGIVGLVCILGIAGVIAKHRLNGGG